MMGYLPTLSFTSTREAYHANTEFNLPLRKQGDIELSESTTDLHRK